jgi:hypothetical protein
LQRLELLAQAQPVAEARQRVLPRLLEELAVQNLQLAVLEGEPPVQLGDAAGGDQAHLQLVAVEGLAEVVVGACLESHVQVVPVPERRKKDEVGVPVPLLAPHLAAELEAVHAGHHPVADDRVHP